MTEQLIVTLTSWERRFANIPRVLDTIFAQTLPPDLVVLNVGYEERVPQAVQAYLEAHRVEVNRVPDTKVYKKLIPTLRRYPEACVISIDDDWLYPEGMIADFMAIHRRFPAHPVSGNHVAMFGLQCHCGCASLTKAAYFGPYLDGIDGDVMAACLSDDIVYTYFASRAGHPYVRTDRQYFINMEPYAQTEGYSDANLMSDSSIARSFDYLTGRFGPVTPPSHYYLDSDYMADLITDVYTQSMRTAEKMAVTQTEKRIYSTHAFRVGQKVLRPLSWLKYNVFAQLNIHHNNAATVIQPMQMGG